MADEFLADEAFAREYRSTKELAESFGGMMAPLSIALFEAFFRFQEETDIRGNSIEFGVFRGRSAAVILKHQRKDERTMLIDVKDTYPDFHQLDSIGGDYDFVLGKSEDLVNDPRVLSFVGKGVRFSHHDASHTYLNVAAEMALMEAHIQPRGLMILDDFGNPSYMQVVAACYAHLAQPGCTLETLLYANNKAYLCRKEDFNLYANFVIEKLPVLLRSAGHNVYLTRTDKDVRYRGFSIAPKANSADPDFYGLHIYGDRFYKTAPLKDPATS